MKQKTIFSHFSSFVKAFQSVFGYSRSTLLGSLASTFEWYDYSLFGYFAPLISQHFFPQNNARLSLLYTFSVFACGFLMRPLGATLFGFIGDRKGRKQALFLSLCCMAAPTTLLALIPNYNSIGYWAPTLLILLRLLQGLAVGGNYGGSVLFVIEHAPPTHKSLAGGFAMFGTLGGLFLGSGSIFILTALLTTDQMVTFGWRIPFLLASLSAIIAYYIHRYAPETSSVQATVKKPLSIIIDHYLPKVLRSIAIIMLDGVGIYILFVFMTTYATVFLHLPEQQVFLSNTLGMGLLVMLIPFFGHIADQYNPQTIIKYIASAFILLPLPCFIWLTTNPSLWALFSLQLIFAIVISAVYGTLPILIVSTFPREIRYTACGLSFNISVAVFGGTAPFLVTSLIQNTGSLMIPAFFLVIIGIIAYLSSSRRITLYD